MGAHRNVSQGGVGARGHADHGARAYNGGLRAEKPAGSRGRAPAKGSGAKLPEAESFKVFVHL